jgi:hypothetical protein
VRHLDINLVGNAQALPHGSLNPFAVLLPAEVLDRIEFLDLGRFCGPISRGSMAGCRPELAGLLVSVFPSRLTPDSGTWSETDAIELARAIESGDKEACRGFAARIQAQIDGEAAPADLSAAVALTTDQIERARACDIHYEVRRRGVRGLRWRGTGAGKELVGPCPVCGGTDRFAVHLASRFSTVVSASAAAMSSSSSGGSMGLAFARRCSSLLAARRRGRSSGGRRW